MLVVLAIVIPPVLWKVFGRYTLEKTLTALAMPCGLVWLGMMLVTFVALCKKQWVLSTLLVLLFAGYTVAGSNFVSNSLMASLERDYLIIKPFEEEFDLVIVLGGGTGILDDGEVKLGRHGDRLSVAARMYHRGNTKRLAATGFGVTSEGYDPVGGAKAAARIWMDWGIPETDIDLIPGTNTSEEANAIKELLGEKPASTVGLLTSAWHLPRAMRLLRAEGLELVPIPSDVYSQHINTWQTLPIRLVPNANSLYATTLATKEYLARTVNR